MCFVCSRRVVLLQSEFNEKIEKKCEHTESDEELDKSHRWTKQADFEKKTYPIAAHRIKMKELKNQNRSDESFRGTS